MTYKIFYCCGEVSESTAYLFINILDVVYAISNTYNGFHAEEKRGLGILSIVWLVCAVGSLIVYLAQKQYKTTIHYVYMVLRFFFVIFSLVMVILTIIALAGTEHNDQNHEAYTAAMVTICIALVINLYDLYLSILLKRIVAH